MRPTEEERKSRHAAYMRAWVAKNRDAVNAKKLARLHANPQAMQRAKEITKAWVAANPERAKGNQMLAHANRKARRLGIEGRLSPGIFSRLLTEQNGKCATCFSDLATTGIHLDHVVPFAKRGSNSDENVRLLCPECNIMKGDLDDADFRGLLLLLALSQGGLHG
jgi:5-methylcytosine-specific restriction endonuclease McrA